MVRVNPRYAYLAALLFVVEVLIAVFVNDRIVRPLVGDVLVVGLVYCFLKAFWPLRPAPAALLVFAFACLVEGLQAIQLVDRLGWRDNRVLATVLGTTFDWKDSVAYGIGALLILLIEYRTARTPGERPVSQCRPGSGAAGGDGCRRNC